MTVRLEPKRPDETRRYRNDWSKFLETDTLQSQTTTSSDVTIVSSDIDAAGTPPNVAVDFVVSGGTDGTNAIITQSIVTAAGDHETETFILPIAVDEIITLAEAKDYLGIFTSDRDGSLMGMITRARLWVEDHTGIALIRRQFVERLKPDFRGMMRLSRTPLVSVDSVTYLDGNGGTATVSPTSYPPRSALFVSGTWPALQPNEAFTVTYTAGDLIQNVDDRLRGAMLALIEGEFSEGYAYPQRSIDSAELCCAYLRTPVP